MTPLEKHIITLQQKVDQLNNEIRTLVAFTSLEPSTAENHTPLKTPVHTKESAFVAAKNSHVGINRYRQLQASE